LMSWSVFCFALLFWNRSSKFCSVAQFGVSFDTTFISFCEEIFSFSLVGVFFLSLFTRTHLNLFVFT
jgi:hypothetical protein